MVRGKKVLIVEDGPTLTHGEMKIGAGTVLTPDQAEKVIAAGAQFIVCPGLHEPIVRMAQDFSMRYLLVDGQGNFGSVMGLAPAAERYTEARLSGISEQMMSELRKSVF